LLLHSSLNQSKA